MFYVHGVQGRVFSGTLAQLRQLHPVTGVARVRGVAPVLAEAVSPRAASADNDSGEHPLGNHLGQDALRAYARAKANRTHQPLTCVADVMRSPALTVPADSTLREAWQILAQRGIAQAPVVERNGALVGLIGRAELLPAASQGQWPAARRVWTSLFHAYRCRSPRGASSSTSRRRTAIWSCSASMASRQPKTCCWAASAGTHRCAGLHGV